ncbi:amino acid ABC transporter permease [Marinimicrococcus flavescens]|uniref:Amino acid ABC transporter permease n=1 Tax=Marinimicrococcus flavescens TaxID=3031815 RepID=A0AAP4D782_9PROT|nr:amino acid ABC transporter permease [Marinimicrococcus flavescens]
MPAAFPPPAHGRPPALPNPPDRAGPPRVERGLVQRNLAWARANLFAGPWNTLLTLLVVALLLWTVPALLDWAVFDATLAPADIGLCMERGGACWAMLQDTWRMILFGPYPPAEHWRPALAVGLFALLVVISLVPAMWLTAGRRRLLLAVWPPTLLVLAVLMHGGVAGLPVVETRLWGGLPLTVILASVGIAFAFLLSLVLALGRQSSMPVVRIVCIAYIELMRGVPLITLLLMASILLPLTLPADVTIHPYLRAQLAFILFFAAYMAEAVRGGLQAIPRGQYAAAKAMGLSYWQSMTRVILPQVLRMIIPSMVNIFISAFKDTSLVIVISMLDLLGTAKAATSNPQWWGLFIEPFAFISAIYLVVCSAMSWYSRLLERRYGTAGAHD